MRVGSLRWWFENRDTGEITIAQFPNWPLWAVLSLWVIGPFLDDGSVPSDIIGWATSGLWVYWAWLELRHGVNPWRRLLGLLVIAWQVAARVL